MSQASIQISALKQIGINDQKFKQESEWLITKLPSSKDLQDLEQTKRSKMETTFFF